MKKNKGGKASRAYRKVRRASLSENYQRAVDAAKTSLGFEAPVTMESKNNFIPGQTDTCIMCKEETPLNDCLYNQSCRNYLKEGQNVSSRHRICTECWFNGKNGKKAFADEDSNHKLCPGCAEGQPIFTPLRIPRSERRKTAQPPPLRSTEIIELD